MFISDENHENDHDDNDDTDKVNDNDWSYKWLTEGSEHVELQIEIVPQNKYSKQHKEQKF